jgi:GDSL-like Lipase/Acylhydrolase family
VLVATTTVVLSTGTPAAAASIDIELVHAGPLGAVTVIGDSVLLGSGITTPTLADRLAEQGWGPIRFHAGQSSTTGAFGGPTSLRGSWWIATWREAGWDAPNVIVNLGANDSVYCRTDLACARRAIVHLLDVIGPGHRIWWPMITRASSDAAEQQTWNTAVGQIAAERADVYTWNWPAEMATGGYASADGIHLSTAGYRKRSLRMAEEFTAALARAEHTGGDAPLPAELGAPSELVPLEPVRVVDTRNDPPGRLGAGATLVVDVTAHVPPGTTAVAANVTAVGAEAAGFLTARPCDRPPRAVSSVNYPAGGDRAAMAVLPLSAAGTLCVTTDAAADVLVDLQGAFVPTGSGGRRFTPLAEPQRLADTRETGRTAVVTVAVPGGADAVALNLTAVDAVDVGFLTAFGCGDDVPAVSNVNFRPGEAVAGSAFVPVGPDGTICVYSSATVDVIVDATGTFAAGGDLAFVPAEPTRVLDTRDGSGGWSPIQGAGQTIDTRVAPPQAEAVTGTLTLVEPIREGFLTAFGCGPVPPTSSVNAERGLVLANAVTVAVTDAGRLCVRSSTVAHTLFDTTGWWVAG